MEFWLSAHDDSLLRMCGEDRLISEMTYEEIKQYPIINGEMLHSIRIILFLHWNSILHAAISTL